MENEACPTASRYLTRSTRENFGASGETVFASCVSLTRYNLQIKPSFVDYRRAGHLLVNGLLAGLGFARETPSNSLSLNVGARPIFLTMDCVCSTHSSLRRIQVGSVDTGVPSDWQVALLFRLPPCAPRVVSDLPAVRRIALEALQDMRKDNVRYAELRTTPRPLADGTSQKEYIENVLRVFQEFETSQAAAQPGVSGDSSTGAQSSVDLGADNDEPPPAGAHLTPRLLLSVDRSKSKEEAMEVARLAIELQATDVWKPYVLGMDFSGNPTRGSFEDFRPAFELARRSGLKVTVHCGEVADDADFLAVIAFRPERLGHAVVLGEEVRRTLLSLVPRIPIEICPTSNLLTLALAHHGEHPTVGDWLEEGCVCMAVSLRRRFVRGRCAAKRVGSVPSRKRLLLLSGAV